AYGPGGEGWFRLSLCTGKERLKEAFDRMAKHSMTFEPAKARVYTRSQLWALVPGLTLFLQGSSCVAVLPKLVSGCPQTCSSLRTRDRIYPPQIFSRELQSSRRYAGALRQALRRDGDRPGISGSFSLQSDNSLPRIDESIISAA